MFKAEALEIPKSTNNTVDILYVDPNARDRAALEQILVRSEGPAGPPSTWELESRSTAQSAFFALRQRRIPILLFDTENHTGSWREMLDLLYFLDHPPMLIVTSRLADERLWAEALNLGAYDVLAKPYDRHEVTRVVNTAWLCWQDQRNRSAAPAGSVIRRAAG